MNFLKLKPLLSLISVVSLSAVCSAANTSGSQLSNVAKESAVWAHVKGTDSWTITSLNTIHINKKDLEKARDLEQFCPSYFDVSSEKQDLCWLRLVGGIVEQESMFRPGDSFLEPDGAMSAGLMALGIGDCPEMKTKEDLLNPRMNLTCGINKLAQAVAADGYISGIGERGEILGAAKVYTTLRAPYKVSGMSLGRKGRILVFTQSYLKQVNKGVFPLSKRSLAPYDKTSAMSVKLHSGFGVQTGGRRLSAGVKLYAEAGSPVFAIEDGKIIRQPYHFYQGVYALDIQHVDGHVVRYGGLDAKGLLEMNMHNGDMVKKGAIIGYIGQVNSGVMTDVAKTIGTSKAVGTLFFELYEGSAQGPLSLMNNNGFFRRSDLMDPTEMLKSFEATTFGASK